MKVRVLLTTPHLQTTASPWREVQAIVKYLPKDEFDLTVCTLDRSPSEEALKYLQKYGTRLIIAAYRPPGHLMRHSTRKSIPALYRSVRSILQVYRNGSYHIHHSLDYISHPFEAVMAWLMNIPFIFHMRNLLEQGRPRLFRMKVRFATKIIAITCAVRDLLYDLGAPRDKIELVYPGLDLQEIHFVPIRQSRSPILLSVGSIEPRKDQETLIRAMELLVSHHKDIRAKVIGTNALDKAYFERLVRLVRNMEIENRVEFIGVKPALPLMEQASVLVHCSRSEAFGWVIVEAMATGLPVVAAAVDGPSEIIEDRITGFLVEPGNIKGFAEAINTVLSMNKDARSQLVQRARLRVERKFNAEIMVSRIARIYREIARRSC